MDGETRLLNRIHEGAESPSTYAHVADASSSSRSRSAKDLGEWIASSIRRESYDVILHAMSKSHVADDNGWKFNPNMKKPPRFLPG